MLGRVNDDLLSIGQFARLARLSVKQLRNYADLGLLPPAWIDPDSGYRYYRAGQARAALSIGLLRSLDVPLAVVATVIESMAYAPDEPDPAEPVVGMGAGDRRAAAALARVRDDLEAELARRRRTLRTLERILEDGLPTPEVGVVSEPPRRVAMLRDVAASPEDIGKVTSACVARLVSALWASRSAASQPPAPGASRTGAPSAGEVGPVRLVGLFPVDFEDTIPITIAVVLPERPGRADVQRRGVAPGGPAHEPEETTAGAGRAAWEGPDTAGAWDDLPPGTWPDILPGGVFARATHVGPYDQIGLTAHSLLAWCAERGHLPAGPLREVYVDDPSVTPPERLVTHLMIPLRDRL
ncbi:MerR family transcriptional regulator [Microtetraspora niveoalba]|uniref:MerR family transcriptional regulator n=1 Tax=Microtetraspora niveoalba TaxID=46175 RepID=UPI00082DF8BD|nr:GyrI-like domain-containing protein [Microtetraspora niveoalba]